MPKSSYPPIRKSLAYVYSAKHLIDSDRSSPPALRKEVESLCDNMLIAFQQALKAEPLSEPLTKQLCDGAWELAEVYKCLGDRGEALKKLDPILKQSLPNSSLAETIKGKILIDYAWDARGTGYANTVSAEAWALMRDRLSDAEAAP